MNLKEIAEPTNILSEAFVEALEEVIFDPFTRGRILAVAADKFKEKADLKILELKKEIRSLKDD